MDLLKGENRPKIFAVVIGIATIIFLIVTSFLSEEEIEIDEQTLCPLDDKYISNYALVLLDGTDDIVGEYAQELHEKVKIIARELPRHGKLSIHDVATGKKRLFMMCAPKSPDDYNPILENPIKLKRDYEEKYLSKVEQAVQAFLENKNRDQSVSPLSESMADVTALSDFLETKNQEFYIFSDMLQNYNRYRHYRDLTPEEFEWLRKQHLYQVIKPKLDGAGVHVYYLLRNRSKRYQSDNHQLFWDNYFQDAGAKNVEWVRINLPGEKGY